MYIIVMVGEFITGIAHERAKEAFIEDQPTQELGIIDQLGIANQVDMEETYTVVV